MTIEEVISSNGVLHALLDELGATDTEQLRAQSEQSAAPDEHGRTENTYQKCERGTGRTEARTQFCRDMRLDAQ